MDNINEIPPEEFERIERYLTHNMDEKELHDFKQSLVDDEQLRRNTEEIQLLLTGIQESAIEEKLKEFHKEITATAPVSAPVRKITFLKKILIAASVLAIACFSYWAFFYQGNQNERLYSKYYTADPGLATVMGNSPDYDFEKAMVEYKNGEYEKAFNAWNILLKQQPENDTLIYFTGVAAQAQKMDSVALNRLQQVVSNSKSAFYRDANWYLGLLYLKQGETKKAISYIQQSGYPKGEDLINDINK